MDQVHLSTTASSEAGTEADAAQGMTVLTWKGLYIKASAPAY